MSARTDAGAPEHLKPIVTVDIVLLALQDGVLNAALICRDREPFAGQWSLPGGWVHPQEDDDAMAAAARILSTKAGIESPYLEQLQCFANGHRDGRGWSISIAHYALVPWTQAHASNPLLRWKPVDGIRSLPFDHVQILRAAVTRIRSKSLYSSLPIHLMPKTFTLSELQSVYEQLLESDLDKRSFRRRIEELDIVEMIGAEASSEGKAHRPAQRYRVKRRSGAGLAVAASNLGLKSRRH